MVVLANALPVKSIGDQNENFDPLLCRWVHYQQSAIAAPGRQWLPQGTVLLPHALAQTSTESGSSLACGQVTSVSTGLGSEAR